VLNKSIQNILLVTGFAPMKLPQLQEMGIPTGPIHFLSGLAGKDALHLSIPTIGPAVLGAYLIKHGFTVSITDYFMDAGMPAGSDLIGISSTFMGIEDVSNIARSARAQNPDVVIVLGGPLSWSVAPERLLGEIPELDYIVMREGENTFRKLIDGLKSGGGLSEVPNIAFRQKEVTTTTARQFMPAEEIMQPDWSLIDFKNTRRIPVLPVETSRGCPFNCAYCSEVTYWDKPVRYREISSVVMELLRNYADYGINTFRFTDSCFSAPPERAARLCDAIYEHCIRQGVPVKWSSYARISNLDRTLLEKMARSGCVALDIGVESGSEKLLRAMGRLYAPSAAINVAGIARELGIITNFNVVVGFPGETSSTIDQTASLIQQAAPDTFSCFLFYYAQNTRVDSLTSEYSLTGQGLEWSHETMDSTGAARAMKHIEKTVTSSANLPGGEYFACYLASLGYSSAQIKGYYQQLSNFKEESEFSGGSGLDGLVQSIRNYL
jgi:anaerobic magnesium-protoporphyrin IX monomethyl ester cyclase